MAFIKIYLNIKYNLGLWKIEKIIFFDKYESAQATSFEQLGKSYGWRKTIVTSIHSKQDWFEICTFFIFLNIRLWNFETFFLPCLLLLSSLPLCGGVLTLSESLHVLALGNLRATFSCAGGSLVKIVLRLLELVS